MASAARPEAELFRTEEDALFRKVPDSVGPEANDWRSALAKAHRQELGYDTSGARAALDAFPAPEGPFSRIATLLRARCDVRDATPESLAKALVSIAALLAELPPEERATIARTHHLRATAMIRLGRLNEAEAEIDAALRDVDGSEVAFVHIVDTLGQILIGQGAWVEAERTLLALVAKRKQDDDPVGVAISGGHLVRVYLALGRAEESAALAREILAQLDGRAPQLTHLRMHTMHVLALVEAERDDELRAAISASAEVRRWVKARAEGRHYLLGYAALTIARAEARLGDHEAARRSLEEATAQFTLPAHVSLLRYHAARIDPRELAAPDWLSNQEKLWAQVEFVSEAEIDSRLLHAHAATSPAERRARLEAAYARAIESNNAVWMRQLDDAASELDPMLFSDRLALRYSGRARAELQKTTRAEATIIFADLVGFTPRALVLSPEEVMDTVRGLFELGVPLLAKYKVQPLTYMGDGLLAIAQGEDHEKRGLAFARELVARTGRITRVREVLGSGLPLHLRAGVASGTVVLGSLGTLFKTEFAAIGATTNLAARLQAKAEPGEVVCDRATALAAGVSDSKDETFELKGYESQEPVQANRIVVV